MMPQLDNPLSTYKASLYDARGYLIDSISVQATSVQGAEEMAWIEQTDRPSWRTVAYIVVEAA